MPPDAHTSHRPRPAPRAATGRALLSSTDPGSPEAGVQYFVGEIFTGAQYVVEGLKYVDEHYDFPTDGVVNGKVLSGKAGKLGDAAKELLDQADGVYDDPAFPFPNGTATFWTGRIPKDKGALYKPSPSRR